MLINIEGLDGVGKSSVVDYISSTLNIPIISKPLNRLLELSKEQSNSIKERIHRDYSPNLQAMYYLMGHLSALEDGHKQDSILDRGFLSTYYFSSNENNMNLFDTFASTFTPPDITIVLYASIEERIRRIKSRNSSDQDLKKKRIYQDGYQKYFEALSKYNIPHLVIPTDNLNEDQVKRLVLRLIELWPTQSTRLQELFSIQNLSYLTNLTQEEIDELLQSKSYTKKRCE